MSLTLRSPVDMTIMFGAVATGSMKAQLQASVAGTISTAGCTSSWQASSPRMGSSTFAVAVLLVISVRNVTMSTVKPTRTGVGMLPAAASCCPSQWESPVLTKPEASAKPPPKSRRICQGVFITCSQFMRGFLSPSSSPSWLFLPCLARTRNSDATTRMAMVSSSNRPFPMPTHSTMYLRKTQARTVSAKTARTAISASLHFGCALRSCSFTGWLSRRSLRDTPKWKTR
mmetsp:Transcript_39381/g.53513  ORF Transcript_39381/g.53513 Transcript_39381/m.53513 type:complete len:229 (+) Transcript_39381:3-689(+)